MVQEYHYHVLLLKLVNLEFLEYLESNTIDMVLDEEEEFLRNSKNPRRFVPREEPTVPFVPSMIFDQVLTSIPQCAFDDQIICSTFDL